MKYNKQIILIVLLLKFVLILNENTPIEDDNEDYQTNKTYNVTEIKDRCFNYSDCFNCSFVKENDFKCNWNGTNCIEDNKSFYKDGDLRIKSSKCSDEASKSLVNAYCGNVKEVFNTSNGFRNEIRLQKNPYNGYGTKNIICGWLSIENASSDLLYLSVSNNESVQIGLEIKYVLYTRFDLVKRSQFNISIAGVKSISFYYHGPDNYSNPPFKIIFEFRNYNTTGLLVIVLWLICVICFAFLILSFLLFVFFCSRMLLIKRKDKQAIKKEDHNNTKIPEEESQNNESSLKQKNKNELLIKSGIYSEQLSKCNTFCAICFELFILGEKIIILNCFHIFHIDCFNNWKIKVKKKFFCPNCHQKTIDGNIKRQTETLSLIDVNMND